MDPNSNVDNVYFHLSGPFVNRFLRVGYFRKIIDIFSHSLLMLIMAVVAWACLRLKLHGTADHAFYATLGPFFLMGWTVLLMCHSCWMAGSCVGRVLHGVLGALAFWTGSLGILAKTIQKRRQNKHFDIKSREGHMASKHSRCGLLGYLLLVFGIITGIALLCVSDKILLLCHRILGLFGFGCLAISQWFSYGTVFARREWSSRWIRVLQLATVTATVMVGYEELFHISQDLVRYFV